MEKGLKIFQRAEILICSLDIFLLTLFLLLRFVFRNYIEAQWAIEFTSYISLVVPHLVLVLAFLGTSIGLNDGKVLHIQLGEVLGNSRSKESGAKSRVWFGALTKSGTLLMALVLCLFAYQAFLAGEFGDSGWIYGLYVPLLLILVLKIIAVKILPDLLKNTTDKGAR